MYSEIKKSHTCEEGGAYLRISFGYLLMKWKNNYLLKKLLKWANRKHKNFNIYIIFLKEKRKTPQDIIILHLCTQKMSMI